MKFLHSTPDANHENSILGAIKDMLADASRIDLAVAYWGHNAIENLAMDDSTPTRVICDLLSGGCNPGEIEKLQGKKNVEVKYLNDLHAKTYWTPTRVVIGSANASANGLGDESGIGTIEAAVQTDDEKVLKQTAKWFDELWRASHPVNDPALRQAREAWLRHRPQVDPNATVLQTLARDPDWFRQRVWVTYYVSDASKKAKAKFQKVKQKYYSPHQLASFEKDGLPLYDWNQADASATTIGDTLIDLTSGTTYELIELVDYSQEDCIALLKEKKDVQGLKFPARERTLLKKAIEEHLAGKEGDFACNLEDLPEVARRYIGARLAQGSGKA